MSPETMPPEFAWIAGGVLTIAWLVLRARDARRHLDVMIQWGKGADDGE